MMKSLFRGLEERRREEVIKSNLIQELRKTVQELVEEYRAEGVLRSAEASNSLCTTLEAIFIHGLKETLKSKFSSVIAGPDQIPEPEFWSLILVFSHRDVIQQVQKLSQISTDIGRSRAWIRLVLNDSLLPSYIESISVQNSNLAPYYKKTALLRDTQMLANLQEEVNSVSVVTFDFPMNSCLLNYWSTPPLLMAGLWTPPIKLTTPVVDKMEEATDLAAELPDDFDPLQPSGYPPVFEPTILYDEDEALKIILGTPVQDSLLKDFQELRQTKNIETSDSSTQIEIDKSFLNAAEETEIREAVNPESSLLNEPEKADPYKTVDFDIQIEQNNLEAVSTEPVEDVLTTGNTVPLSSPTTRRDSNNSESFDILIKSYNPATNIASPTERQNNLENILQSYDMMTDIVKPNFKNPPDSMSASLMIENELKSMVDHLGKLVWESGLISQDFRCKRCGQHIGVTFASFKVCNLTGHYYCVGCFDEKEFVIPARILHNWDFSKHSVSGKAFEFLTDVQSHPLINVRVINPKLYFIEPEMRKLQEQRMKLNLLRMYLMTCREPVIEALKKQLWPREYLYEHIHLYSVSDLLEIPSSSLSQTLCEVIKFCESHVVKCNLCSQKGFICEICNSKKVIFPFHLDTTSRCPKCSLVLHSECKLQVDECPKCLRIQKRTS